MAEVVRHFIASRYGGRDVPVTLVLPDGARVPLSTAPAADIVARSWKGLRALATPALGSLARAYVRGEKFRQDGGKHHLGLCAPQQEPEASAGAAGRGFPGRRGAMDRLGKPRAHEARTGRSGARDDGGIGSYFRLEEAGR